MIWKTFLLAFIVLSAGIGPAEPQRQKRFLNSLTSPLTSGLQSMTNLVTGGVKTATNQVGNLAANVQKQTSNLVQGGTNLALGAIEMISAPAINAATTVIVGKFNLLSRLTGKDVIKIPAVDTSLMGFGTLKTSEGQLKLLSTLTRDGPVQVTAGILTIRLAIPIKFANLSVNFDNYSFNTWGININGNLKATIKENSFVAYITFQPGITCQVNIEKVEVKKLEGLDVEMTGLCGWCSSVVTYVANFLQGMIQTQVQTAVDQQLRDMSKDIYLLLCSRPQAAA